MAIHEIRVRNIEKDVKGQEVAHEAQRTIGVPVLEKVGTTRVYRLEGTNKEEARKLAETLFCDPITQTYTLNKSIFPKRGILRSITTLGGILDRKTDIPRVVEVAYKPGVMNPEVGSILKAAHDVGVQLTAVDSSTEYGFYGKKITNDAATREEAVQKLKVMMTEDAIKQHMTEKHWTKNPNEPMSTVEEAHMMIDQTTKQVS